MHPLAQRQEAALAALSALDRSALAERLTACCGSSKWVAGVLEAAPFRSIPELFQVAERVADRLEPEDWLEAFSHHPRIGDLESLRARFGGPTSDQWASGEQAGAANADERVLRALAIANETYEARFGFIFIVCATGKTAEEMLTLLRQRMMNDPLDGTELQVAAEEQRKITRLRLEKMLAALIEEKSA